MATKDEDVFYVGYLPLPNSMKRIVIVFAAVCLLGMLGFAALAASKQQAGPPAVE